MNRGFPVYFLLLVIVLFSFPPEVRGQSDVTEVQNLRLGMLPFRAAGDIGLTETKIISQIMLNQLSEYQSFNLVEVQNKELQRETSFQLSGLVNEEEMVELGQRLELTFLITGNVEGKGKNVKLTLQVTEIENGRVVYGKISEFSKEEIEKGLRIFVNELAADLEKLALGNSLDEIETYITLHMWDKAYAGIKEYRAVYGDTPRLQSIRKKLFSALADETRDRILHLQEYTGANEWIDLVPLLLAYSDASPDLEPFLLDLYDTYQEKLFEEWEEKKELIEDQIEAGQLDRAESELKEARREYPYNEGFAELQTQIDRQRAALHVQRAHIFKRSGNYTQAAFYVEKALTLVPDSAEYVQLLVEVETLKERREERKRTVASQKARWAPTRRNTHHLEASLSMSFYTDKLSQMYVDGAYPAAELAYLKYSPIAPPLYRYMHAGAGLTWGEERISGSAGSVQNNFLHPEIHGGIGAALRFTRFEFAVDARLALGVLHRKLDFDELDPSQSGKQIDITGSTGLRGLARYSFNNHFEAGICFGTSPVYVLGEGSLQRFSVGLAAGWTF
jgi:TolB-like protein/tetratricopeptide (TPR) repeat protein